MLRGELSAEYGIAEDWWGRQPRCTAKTGWVVLAAHIDIAKRTQMQIAACRLGIAIVASDLGGGPGGATAPSVLDSAE